MTARALKPVKTAETESKFAWAPAIKMIFVRPPTIATARSVAKSLERARKCVLEMAITVTTVEVPTTAMRASDVKTAVMA